MHHYEASADDSAHAVAYEDQPLHPPKIVLVEKLAKIIYYIANVVRSAE
jgi:hypothetical protein